MSKYHHNYGAFDVEVLNATFMEAHMLAVADAAMAIAVATAPFDAKSKDGTHFKDAFSTSAGKHGGMRKNRAYGRLQNDDSAAFWIEVGTRDTPAHRTLTRAMIAASGG